MVGCNPGGGSAVTSFMGTRFTKILLLSALAAVPAGDLAAQCPQFLGTEVVADLPATAASPHWFHCIGSVTADPAPFTFELTGFCLTVDTACSAMLVALHAAWDAQRLAECGRTLQSPAECCRAMQARLHMQHNNVLPRSRALELSSS